MALFKYFNTSLILAGIQFDENKLCNSDFPYKQILHIFARYKVIKSSIRQLIQSVGILMNALHVCLILIKQQQNIQCPGLGFNYRRFAVIAGRVNATVYHTHLAITFYVHVINRSGYINFNRGSYMCWDRCQRTCVIRILYRTRQTETQGFHYKLIPSHRSQNHREIIINQRTRLNNRADFDEI